MGYLCDFCGEQKSMVYCQSDAASLCLSCDRNVHSANALSRRHSRTLVCERCNSQPSFVRCIEERISLCQNCNWMGHACSVTASTHKRQAVNCYSGCPSAAELYTIWPFVQDLSAVDSSTCEKELSSMSIAENSLTNCNDTLQSNKGQGNSVLHGVNVSKNVRKLSVWPETSSLPLLNSSTQNAEQPVGLANSTSSKACCAGSKAPALCGVDEFDDDFNIDEVDLFFENYEELFGIAPHNQGLLFEEGGIDCLFDVKDMIATDIDCQSAYPAEGSSIELVNPVQPACSNAASADSILSSKTEPNLCFAKQAHSSLSFSGLTGDTSAGDYQDCGASSMLPLGEPPWFPQCPEISMPSASRTSAVLRYKEKKKSRKFEKHVRYASRKARADVRKRVKGRFVKAGDAYDYDPLSQTRSY